MREAYAALGDVLSYPGDDPPAPVARALGLVPAGSPAAESLARLVQALASMSPSEARREYTRSFDLTPAAAPYLSVHLFGEDNFRRAPLMVGLAAAYDRAGFDCRPELPDHVGVVLRFAPRFEDEVWADLVSLCLDPALESMQRDLERAGSAYVHAVAAVRLLLAAQPVPEVLHA